MKLSEFKSAAESCIKDAATLEDGVSAVNALLESQGLEKNRLLPGHGRSASPDGNGMPCGVLAAVSLLRERYGRPVAAYVA